MFRKGFVISTITAILAALPCIADTGYSARINELIAQKQAKMKELEKCQGTTKNLKIAGLSTLGITAVGVGANIAEAVLLNEYEGRISEAQKAKDAAEAAYQSTKKVYDNKIEKNKAECMKLKEGTPSYDSENNVCTLTQKNNVNKEDFDGVKTLLNDDNYDCKEEINDASRFKAICEDLSNSEDFTLKFDIDCTLSDAPDGNVSQKTETAPDDATPQQQSNEPSAFEKQCTKLGLTPEPFTNYIKCKLEIATTTDLKSAKMPLTDYHKAFKCDKDKKVTCVGNVCSLECTKSSKSDTEYDVIEVKYKEITCPIAGQVVQPNGCECKEGSTLSPNGKSCIDNITNEPIKAAAKKQETKPQNNNNDNELVKKCDGVANKNFCKRCTGDGVELEVKEKHINCIKMVSKRISATDAANEFLEFKKQIYPESNETYFDGSGDYIYHLYEKQPGDSKRLFIAISYIHITCPIDDQIVAGDSVSGLCVCPKGQELNKEQNECIPEKTAKTIECQNKGEIISGNVCVCPDSSKFKNNMCVIDVPDYKKYRYDDVKKGIATAKKYLKTNNIDTTNITCESEDEPGRFGDDYILCYPTNTAVYRFQFDSLNAEKDEELD